MYNISFLNIFISIKKNKKNNIKVNKNVWPANLFLINICPIGNLSLKPLIYNHRQYLI